MATPSAGQSLLQAVKRGSLDTVRSLSETANTSAGIQGTLLYAAIQENQPEIARYLIAAGCDVNAADIKCEPPISLAIRTGHPDMVEMLLQSKHCDIHRVDPVSLNQPLGVAVTHGTVAMVKMLIDAGCDVSKQGKDYNTVWHLAVIHRKRDIIDILAKAKSGDVNMVNKNGKSALHLAAEQSDAVMLRCLLAKCRIMCKKDINVTYSQSPRVLDLDQQIISEGNTPLHLGIWYGSLSITKLLIDAGCNIDVPNEMMYTPLFVACKVDCIETIALLLKKGADPNVISRCNTQFHVRSQVALQSPLHVAVRLGSLAIVRLLVEAGANLNSNPTIGRPHLLIQALMEDKPQIVDYLLTDGVQHNLDVSYINGSSGQNALGVIECCSNVRGFAQRLIDFGCMVDGLHDNRFPLEYAIDFSCMEAVKVLLDNGADVNASLSGFTALQHCVMDNMSDDLFQLLLLYGADINVRTVKGHSLFKLAFDNCNTYFVELLVVVGYNLSKEEKLRDYVHTHLKCCGVAYDAAAKASHDEGGLICNTSPAYNETELAWFTKCAAIPCTLFTQCRSALRTYFADNGIPMKRMTELNLPSRVKDFITLKTLLDETVCI